MYLTLISKSHTSQKHVLIIHDVTSEINYLLQPWYHFYDVEMCCWYIPISTEQLDNIPSIFRSLESSSEKFALEMYELLCEYTSSLLLDNKDDKDENNLDSS